MVTRTTPSRANACPSYAATAELPWLKAPPWIQTITGRPVPPGVHTFRVSQLSPGMFGSGRITSMGGG